MPRSLLESNGLKNLSLATECRSIPLAGVPQIPDDVEATIRMMGEWALTDEQLKRAKAAIADAKLELNRRIVAHKLGVPLEKHFAYTPDQARAKELHREKCRQQRAARKRAEWEAAGDRDDEAEL